MEVAIGLVETTLVLSVLDGGGLVEDVGVAGGASVITFAATIF